MHQMDETKRVNAILESTESNTTPPTADHFSTETFGKAAFVDIPSDVQPEVSDAIRAGLIAHL